MSFMESMKPPEICNISGEEIKSLRKDLDFTQKDLSKTIQSSSTTVGLWEAPAEDSEPGKLAMKRLRALKKVVEDTPNPKKLGAGLLELANLGDKYGVCSISLFCAIYDSANFRQDIEEVIEFCRNR